MMNQKEKGEEDLQTKHGKNGLKVNEVIPPGKQDLQNTFRHGPGTILMW